MSCRARLTVRGSWSRRGFLMISCSLPTSLHSLVVRASCIASQLDQQPIMFSEAAEDIQTDLWCTLLVASVASIYDDEMVLCGWKIATEDFNTACDAGTPKDVQHQRTFSGKPSGMRMNRHGLAVTMESHSAVYTFRLSHQRSCLTLTPAPTWMTICSTVHSHTSGIACILSCSGSARTRARAPLNLLRIAVMSIE
jgi:hypothetical protein